MRAEVRAAVPPGLRRSMQMRALLFRKKGAVRVFFFPLSSFLSSPAVLGEPGTFTQFQAGALERLGQLTR